jgi:hypothetical protein
MWDKEVNALRDGELSRESYHACQDLTDQSARVISSTWAASNPSLD